MATDVGLLAELLELVFQDSRDILLELNIHNVISTCKRENPQIEGLDIGPDLRVNAGSVLDGPGAAQALVTMIFTVRDYIEVFFGSAESDEMVGNSISKFSATHDPGDMARLREAYPELFSLGKKASEDDIDKLDDAGKLHHIFQHLMRRVSRGAAGNPGTDPLPYLRRCESVRSVSDDLESLEFTEGITAQRILDLFPEAVEALGITAESAKSALDVYGPMIEELGISSKLFGGALSSTTTFGCPPVDRLLRDGLRKDCTVLFEGPAGVEKEVLASMFLVEGLKRDGCAIAVFSACSANCIRRGLASMGLDVPAAESEGRLIFVDWHSRFTERITSIDVSENTLKVSNDLTNLAVGIDMALKMSARHSQVRLVMDIASSTIVTEGFDRVHEFLNSVRAKMKNHSCTGLILINPHMLPGDQTSMLGEIFDGTMCIERGEQHGRLRSGFRITHLSGMAFSPARLGISITQRGMEISDGGDAPPEIVAFDHGDEKSVMGLLGIESLSPGGLPTGKSYLVRMPSSLMPADYVKQVVMEAQKDGHALLLALSSVNTDTIGEWMSEKGLSRKGLIDRGLLQVVDWYGQKSAKVLGMEIDEGLIRTSRDLTHLGVGIDLALRKISEQFSSLAVMEVLSQAIRLFDLRATYAFAQSVNAKLAGRGFTSFTLMERDAHDSAVNAAVEELFDGIIDIRQAGDSLEIALLSLRGSHFQSEYRPLTRLRDRLTVDVFRSIPDAEVVESMAGQGLSAKLKDLQSELEKVSEEKQALEKRLAQMTGREAEHEMRHSEMRVAMQEVEAKLAQAGSAGADSGAANPTHRVEMSRLLKLMDDMLENLPQDVIDSFARSEDFKLYERILALYLEDEE